MRKTSAAHFLTTCLGASKDFIFVCVGRCEDWDCIDGAQKTRLELAKVEDGEFW